MTAPNERTTSDEETDAPEGSSDGELLLRWQAGRQSAGAELMKRYHGLLARFFQNKVSEPDEVHDLVADTLLACTRGRDGIRNAKSFRSYLFGTAFNQLRRHYQKQTKRALERADFEHCCIAELDPAPPQGTAVVREQQTHLAVHGLRSLPLSYQIVLELSLFEGMSGREIGELLDLPTATVHTRLRRGKEQLAAEVARLTSGPKQWGPTVTDLETWAEQLRARAQL